MTYFFVDDRLHDHPKWLALQSRPGARALWTTAGSWSGDKLTNGRIPRSMLARLGGKPKDAAALVEVGLWEETPDGWVFHQWHSINPSKEEVEERRARRAAAGRKGGQRSGASRRQARGEAFASADASASDEADASALAEAKTNPNPIPRPGAPYGGSGSHLGSVGESSVTRRPTTPAGQVVAAWSEACRAAGFAPIGDQATTVGRLARELLDEGNHLDLVTEAALLAAAKRRPWIADEIGPAVEARRKAQADVVSADDPLWGATLGRPA